MKNPFPSSIFCSSPLRSVLLFALSLFGLLPQTNAQYFRVTNDSMLLKNNNNTGVELIIENDTRNKTGAFLMNRLNGRTEFAYAADSIYIRNDSLLWRRGDGTRGIKLPSVNGGGGGSNSDTTAVTKVFFKSSETADSIFYRRNGIDSLAGIIDRQAGFKVGGLVTHRSGLTFDVTAANPYYIGTGRYASEAGEITLDPADDSLTRRDAIVLNTAGQIVKITGVPSTTPADPQPDPAVHYPLTYITVPPNSETPANVTSAIPYDEHVEWTVSSNSVTINPDNTTNVFTGTKSLSAGVTTSASYIDFTLPIGFNIADFTDFSFYIKLISGISNARINVKFFHGSTPVGNAVNISTSNGFTANKLTYQTIIIPMSSFAITQSDITKVRISTTGNTAGFFLDLLRFQKGISQGGNGSAFDWRIATPTQVGGIKTGGEGYYLDPDGKLHLAPINLSRYDSAYYRSDSLGPRKWKLTRLNGDTTYFELLPDSAHKLVSLGVTGSSPKTLTATLHNGETVSTTFSDISGGNSTDTASLSARINAKASQQALIDTAANIRASIPTGSSGTVSTVSVASANGFAGTVATATTTPAITIQTTVTGILKGNATSVSAAVSGTDFEGPIAAGSAGQYWRYDKTWQALNTTAVAEGSNLYFTNARSRLSISFLGENYLAYDNTTGVVTANSINLSGSHVTGTLAAGRIAGTATNGYVATLVGGVPTWAAASGGGGSTGWGLTGNSGTSYLTNFIGTTDNASLRFRANNIERLKIDSATGVFYNTTVASSSLAILANGSVAQLTPANIGSTLIGGVATFNSTATYSTALGNATVIGAGSGSFALGYGANASGGGIAIASGTIGATSTGGITIGSSGLVGTTGVGMGTYNYAPLGGVAIGYVAQGAGTNATSVGPYSSAAGTEATALGPGANSAFNYAIALGSSSKTTAINQFVAGASPTGGISRAITEVYFGSGPAGLNTVADSIDGTHYSINGSGGNRSNTKGGNLTIAGGKGIDAGLPGDVILATSTTNGGSNVRQTLTNRWWVKGGTGTLSNVASPDASAAHQIDGTGKGTLLNRGTKAQRDAIASPAQGLLYFVTDGTGYLSWYNSGWQKVSSISDP